MVETISMFVISALSIVLGFFALLKQKTYIDAETKQPTAVEIPFAGKLKTNYPALVFVFLGFAASIFAFDRIDKYNRLKQTDTWSVTGSFKRDTSDHSSRACSDKKINFRSGKVSLQPAALGNILFYDNRQFEFTIAIEKGKSFEDAVTSLRLSLDSAEIDAFFPSVELELFKSNKKSKLSSPPAPLARTYTVPYVVQCE